MSDAPEISREIEIIGQLVELDLSVAKLVHRRVHEAGSHQELIEATRAYQRQSRTVRMSLALRERMLKARKDAPEVEQRLFRERDPAREQRKAELGAAVRRVIWRETEGEKADWLTSLLEQRLELQVCSPAFGLDSLDDHISDVCDGLGLRAHAADDWRTLPDPVWPDAADDEEPEFDSSA